MAATQKLNNVFVGLLFFFLVGSGCASPQPQPIQPVPTAIPSASPTATPNTSNAIIFFNAGATTMVAGSDDVINAAVAYMKATPNVSVSVNGYTSSIGAEGADFDLSDARAAVIVKALEVAGVEPLRVTASGYGKTGFAASNKTPAGRALNDRVELVFKP